MISFQIILYIISLAMFFSILAIGFGLTLRSVKFFNISYTGSFLVGGYMMFLFYKILLIPFAIAITLSLLASGLYLVLSYKLIFSQLLKRKASNFVLLIASFGLLTATSAIFGMIFGSQSTIAVRQLSDIGTIKIFSGSLNIIQASSIIITPIIILILALLFKKTNFGKAVRAVEDNAEIAEIAGISKEKIFLKLFFLSGVLAGLGGIAEAMDVGINPNSSMVFILSIIVMVIVGGMESFWGGILGAFILAIAQNLTVVFFGGNWEQAVPFVILIIMLLIRPQGILKK